MTEEIRIREGSAADLERLETMWIDFYETQLQQGMFVRISRDGFQQWVAGIRPILGRFACLFLVEHGQDLVGFLAGKTRALPSYFGGSAVGFISEVYVRENSRKHGAGSKLVVAATRWFREHGIKRLELQVLPQNLSARRVYQKLGWTEELIQMVLPEESDPITAPGE